MQKGKPASAACVFFLFLLFLLLLLTPVSPQCRTATPDECKLSGEFIPGHSLASRGFDITTLKHTQNDVLDLSEWEKSDGSCTLCENPLLHGKPLQRLPLAITDWKANIACEPKVQVEHYATESCMSMVKVMAELLVRNDWKKELDVKPCKYNPCGYMGFHSTLASFCNQKQIEDNYIFLLHHVSCSYYKIRIDKDKSVSAKFKDNLNLLPEKYGSHSKRNYYELILDYGTHFITELDLGVLVSYLTNVPACRMVFNGVTLSEISRCLEIELDVLIGLEEMTKHPDFQMCKKKITHQSFHSLIKEQVKDLEGGQSSQLDLRLQADNFPESSKDWLESVKRLPALLPYSLEPLHTLLDKNDPRRESLRQAVSAYVTEYPVRRNCTRSCPSGTQQSASDPCSCECPNDTFTTSMCCSREPGLANLTVVILHAEGLWGDYITQSDAYVKVLFQKKELCTSTVWGDDNPSWSTNLHFGHIKLTGDFSHIEIQVWDQDSGWDDDLLGRCMLTLKPWEYSEQVCFLNHGRLHYRGYLVCGPYLGGPSCRDFSPTWEITNWQFLHFTGIPRKQIVP